MKKNQKKTKQAKGAKSYRFLQYIAQKSLRIARDRS